MNTKQRVLRDYLEYNGPTAVTIGCGRSAAHVQAQKSASSASFGLSISFQPRTLPRRHVRRPA